MAEKGDGDFKLQPFNVKSEEDILNKFTLPIKSNKSSPEFSELMPDFGQPHNLSDIILCIGERCLHAHRAVLMQWSPVFKAMFSSDFQEKGAKQIPLPGKEYDEVLDLLCYIYPPCKQSISADNVRHMVKLADEYQIKFIKAECEQFLTESASHDNAMEYLYLAETFSLNDLQTSESSIKLCQCIYLHFKISAFEGVMIELDGQKVTGQ
ncbi:unnamed protein product [Owenia fusiformis]|uniref:BTB domain-containing protein n=1 Tax=Owenia fusiformis TaxID=6347 RepID=A0A8S4P1R1_OWEFU|nr:unnamed protein product [Owenia fusiformis]